YLREPPDDFRFSSQERQGGWVMAKKQHPLLGLKPGKGLDNNPKMFRAQALPLRTLLLQCVRFKDRQRDQRRNHARKYVVAQLKLPKGLQPKLLSSPIPTRQAHSSTASKEADFAQFVIPKYRKKLSAESLAHFVETFARASGGGIVAGTETSGVARVIPVG